MNSRGVALNLKGVSKSFFKGGEELRILQELELTLDAGSSLAILGASGVGKSTLLTILGTLEHPDRGEILMDGKEVRLDGERTLAKFRNETLGFVFQFHHLLKDFNAIENVAMPLRIRGVSRLSAQKRAVELLKRLGLGQRLNHRPAELSGGEQQRVAIARAMVGEPRLLLADEPTGNLDRMTGEQIQEVLLQLNQEIGCTMVLVTHNEVFASKMNRQVWLHDGKIVNHHP